MLEHRYCAVQGKEVFICFVEAVREVIVVEDAKELSRLFMQRIRPRAVCAQREACGSSGEARRCLPRDRRLRTPHSDTYLTLL